MKNYKILMNVGALAGLLAGALVANAADAKADTKPYPLLKCIVSGDKLDGDMGKPYVFAYKDREIKLCCKSCLDDFNKSPAAFLEKIDAAAKKAAKEHPYPLKTCLVSGDKFSATEKPFSFVYEEREIKFCCQDCMKDFKKDTAKFMKVLAAADKTTQK
jgi:hypothetical protein